MRRTSSVAAPMFVKHVTTSFVIGYESLPVYEKRQAMDGGMPIRRK
ncbi:hypothetical protein [Pseudobacillus badius]|nr:hypothetical protein [Bacillus badius]MED0665855.1 hypothetical protein [Bacillus badius]UAT32757.1 hypothetical protein K7T73_07990 [Bacillus badius]GLY11127.1 hypothetical protein Bbad01_23430 [Bacillus badius]